MLNMGNATKAVVRAGFGAGKGVVWLDELKCRGEYILMSVRGVLEGPRPLVSTSCFSLCWNRAASDLLRIRVDVRWMHK